MRQLSKINNPFPFEDYPIVHSRNEDGALRDIHSREKKSESLYPTKAKEPKFHKVPQIDRSKKDGFITGISLGLSRALMRAGMYHYSFAMEFLADMGYLGTALMRKEFISLLSEYLGKHGSRRAFDEFAGKASRRIADSGLRKYSVKRGRKSFEEYVVKKVPDSILIDMLKRTKLTTKSGRGRPCTAWVYIHTEGELKQLLITAGLASEIDNLAFKEACAKPMTAMENLTVYKDFIMCTTIFEKGTKKYSRRELGEPVGRHINSVRKGAERMGIKVSAQDPICSLIKPEELQFLPINDDDYERWVTLKIIPPGTHIRNAPGKFSKIYKYTQAGANLCRETSLKSGGPGKIYKACYSASEYDPSYSPFAK